jgi:hypothetical protein
MYWGHQPAGAFDHDNDKEQRRRVILGFNGESTKATSVGGIGIEGGYVHSLLGCAWLDRDASYKQ